MTTVVSADDWPLFLLCLLIATVLLFLGPGFVSFTAVAVVAILIYVFRRGIRAGFEAVMGSDAPLSNEREQ
ncbi:hypothetical protein DMJ13_18215 [halophilic archaeon]|nr:hypothetical protein DMJ13_18215 [halophilic archaeon]